MIVSLQVKQSNKPPVVVRTDKRLGSFKNRHTVSLNENFLPLKSPSLSTFQHPQAAQLVVAKHTQSFRCNSSHSFVSGRKVSHFEECAIFLHLNGNNKTLMKRIIIQIFNSFLFYISPTVTTVCRNLHTVDKCSVTQTLISAHLIPERINGSS